MILIFILSLILIPVGFLTVVSASTKSQAIFGLITTLLASLIAVTISIIALS